MGFRTDWPRGRARHALGRLLGAAALVAAAVMFNTHVLATDGPGPIGMLLGLWLAAMAARKRIASEALASRRRSGLPSTPAE